MTLTYPVPWRLIFGLGKHVVNGTRTSFDDLTAAIIARMQPPAIVEGEMNLPPSPRFVLVANHFQRRGLWIVHPAAVLTQAIRQRYGPGDPPVHWVVTANWPRIRIGPINFASPGDFLLPRLADVLACYPVWFARRNPAATAAVLRRILRQAPKNSRPLGIFPEGVEGFAGCIADPVPGVERLLFHLAQRGMPIVPAGISENGTLVIRFGQVIDVKDLLSAPDTAKLAMGRVLELV